MDIFVINLDRHPQRLAHMVTQLRGLPFHRIAAIDGRNLEGADRHKRRWSRAQEPLTRYERACIESHRRTLDRFLQSGAPHACILEDDLVISPEFPAFMAESVWAAVACDIIRLETNPHQMLVGRHTDPCRDRTLVGLHAFIPGGAAYIVNREGARKLLPHLRHPARPMDHILYDVPPMTAGVRILQLDPALCLQARFTQVDGPPELFQSAIQKIFGTTTTRPFSERPGRYFGKLMEQLATRLRWARAKRHGSAIHRTIAFR